MSTATRKLLLAEAVLLLAPTTVLVAQLYSPGYIYTALATGSETVFPAYARQVLPTIQTRLDRAARSHRDPARRLHLQKMSDRISTLLAD